MHQEKISGGTNKIPQNQQSSLLEFRRKNTYIWKRKEWVVLGQTLAKTDLLLPVYKSRLISMIFLVKSQKSNIILRSFLQSHSSDSLSFSSR